MPALGSVVQGPVSVFPSPLKVAFRADAAAHIGFGHLRRCLALARALQQGGAEVRILWRNLGTNVGKHSGAGEILDEALPAPSGEGPYPEPSAHSTWARVPVRRDAQEVAERLADWSPDWVIVDHYSFDAEWHDLVRTETGACIASIDDLGDRMLSADLIIDQNWHPNFHAKYGSVNVRKARILGGPRFALLDAVYASAAKFRFQEPVQTIGIFMGGVDVGNYSSLALQAVRLVGFEGLVEVVSTSANPNLDRLREACSRHGATLTLNLSNLSHFFAAHDLQVGAGGSATWERCCVGAPTISVAVAENQRDILRDLAAEGVVFEVPEPTLEAITSTLVAVLDRPEARLQVSMTGKELVDGFGARRVAASLQRNKIAVRSAKIADAILTHGWRNHPSVRSVSRDSSEIDVASHVAWTEACIRDEKRHLLVASAGSDAIGVARFDCLADNLYEVSIYLDPVVNGLGLGNKVLLAAEAWMIDRHGSVEVVAETLPENRPSERLFAATGYQKTEEGYRKRLSTLRGDYYD